MSRLLAIATLGLSASVGATTLAIPCEESGGGEVPECVAPKSESHRTARLAPRDALPYLFWV